MSIYRATVIAPRGVSVKVKPRKLKFTKKNEKLSYMLSVSAKPLELLPGNSETVFGQLLWSDGKHVVQSPIVVTRQKPY
uniref:Subtilisin-like protease fibronectin type-III domain-containing protein n=1 Tax=Picea sitchensis TaxID=3332 RepID=C0PTQ8_PICSI|nr:unknown [Picea sitchensis]